MASVALGAAVAAALGRTVQSVTPVGGGCISDAGRVELAGGLIVFAKAAAGLPEGLLDVEAAGLRWLGEVPGVQVPAVLAASPEVLVLEWVEPGSRTDGTGEDLGRQLAALHRAGPGRFGWHRDGFIGTVPQRNTPQSGDWGEFWVTRRIGPLVDRAVAAGTLDPRARPLVDRLAGRLPERAGPAEPPA